MTGPPFLICFSNKGITDPLEPKTLPKRVVTNCVTGLSPACSLIILFRLWQYISQIRLEHPITFVGLTALSVDIITNFLTPYFTLRSAITFVPRILFCILSEGLFSIIGTCLYAAAWNT